MNDNTKKVLMRLLAILIVFIISYAYNRFFMKENLNNSNKVNLKDNINNSKFTDVDLNNEDFNILFMYVGQADSTLIKYKNKIMLIDAGNNEDGKNIVKFLKDKGISKLDYIVGTHYDEDHIGGLDDIIENFDIGKFYLSNGGELGPNYYNLEKAAKKKNLAITIPKVGDKIDFGDVDMEVMAASKFDGKNDNNASIVIQAKYGSRKYLFMGDLEKQEEAKRKWNEVDVLKAGHHGSNTSSTQEFLNQVKPKYVFVSAGKNNKYRLPNVKAMERIEKTGAKIFRTDVNESSFWLISNGNDIDIKEVSLILMEMEENSMFNFLKFFKRKKEVKFEVEGEVYKIDEIGDDDKYVFLTRESDGSDKQVFDISDELYNKILDDRSIEYLIYKNGKFEVK